MGGIHGLVLGIKGRQAMLAPDPFERDERRVPFAQAKPSFHSGQRQELLVLFK
jgi:hypothetical protein